MPSTVLQQQQQLFDERYQSKTHQLKLFVELSKDHLFSTLFDDSSKEYVAFEAYHFEENTDWNSAQRKFEQIFLSDQFQQAKTRQLNISSSLYTLVPQALFDENELINYLSFNHPIEDESTLRFYFNKIESIDAIIVYAIPLGLEFLAKAKLPPFQINHFGLPLLEAIGLQKVNKDQLHVHIQQHRFDIIYMPEGKLIFFNSFNYQSTEDFIYYLLYIMEQLQLDRETTNLQLIGEIEENSSIYKVLYTYIRSVEFMKHPKDIHFSAVLAELPSHYYFTLFNQHLCG
ncbi:MAG: DUF3822 family protein [Flavobacteriales bacterium]|nr:DUF3822 family protein [Flavobacteriales bacterium]